MKKGWIYIYWKFKINNYTFIRLVELVDRDHTQRNNGFMQNLKICISFLFRNEEKILN